MCLTAPLSFKMANGCPEEVTCDGHCDEMGSAGRLEAVFFLVDFGGSGLCSTFFDFAIGKDRPRSFPRLATPIFHVKAVLYPEHPLPWSRHCVQYGRFLSHFCWLSWHEKQSSAAPLAGALRLRFRGEVTGWSGAAALAFSGGFTSAAVVMAEEQDYA